MSAVKARPLSQSELAQIPNEGVILIRPYPNLIAAREQDKSKTWGYTKRSGWFSINKQHIEGWNHLGQTVGIHGLGTLLDMSNPEHRKLYAIFLLSDQFKGVISESKSNKYGPNSRFYFENHEMEAQKYLASLEVKNQIIDQVRGLNPQALQRIATWFSLGGSETLKKATLLKMADTEDGRKKLGEILLSPDRDLLELIAVAETKGNITKKEGLYKNGQTGVYYWNDLALGLGRGAAIAYLKANFELQSAIKELYWVADIVEAPVQVAKPAGATTTTTGAKKEVVKEGKYTGTPDEAAIFAAYNAQPEGEKDFAAIGRPLKLHWKTIEKIVIKMSN